MVDDVIVDDYVSIDIKDNSLKKEWADASSFVVKSINSLKSGFNNFPVPGFDNPRDEQKLVIWIENANKELSNNLYSHHGRFAKDVMVVESLYNYFNKSIYESMRVAFAKITAVTSTINSKNQELQNKIIELQEQINNNILLNDSLKDPLVLSLINEVNSKAETFKSDNYERMIKSIVNKEEQNKDDDDNKKTVKNKKTMKEMINDKIKKELKGE